MASRGLPRRESTATQTLAMITALSRRLSQETSTVGVRKLWRTWNASPRNRRYTSSTPAPVASVRRVSRPMPHARETTAQRWASAAHAGTPSETGCWIAAISPWISPRIPTAVGVAANTASPTPAMRFALLSTGFRYIGYGYRMGFAVLASLLWHWAHGYPTARDPRCGAVSLAAPVSFRDGIGVRCGRATGICSNTRVADCPSHIGRPGR